MWPSWCRGPQDLPADLALAIKHALLILSWREATIEQGHREWMPPRWMWPLDWELEDWWGWVRADQKSDTDRVDYDDETRYEQNPLAAGLGD
jgi:hypothetical protein